MDPQTVDQNYAQLQQQGQQTAALIQALAGKLQAAAAAGDMNAREWMLDLKEVALGVQQEEGQVSLLLQSIHSMVDNHVQSTGQPGYQQQGYQQPQPGYQQQGYQPQQGYQQGYQQQGGMMGGGGGGMLQSFLGGGFGRAIVSGAGFGIGDVLANARLAGLEAHQHVLPCGLVENERHNEKNGQNPGGRAKVRVDQLTVG